MPITAHEIHFFYHKANQALNKNESEQDFIINNNGQVNQELTQSMPKANKIGASTKPQADENYKTPMR